MSDHAVNLDRLFDLVGVVCDDIASSNDFLELDSIVQADEEARNWYLHYCRAHSALRLELRAYRATQAVCQQISREPSVVGLGELDVVKVVTPASLAPAFPATLPTSLFPSTIVYSSGWTIAYLSATVITGLLILGFWLMPASRPEQVAHNSVPSVVVEPKVEYVGRITGMVDCKIAGSRVSLGQKLDLTSGLVEITYDTGANVILQGPVTYSVEANGGYLSVGKLTGKLEKKAESGKGRAEGNEKLASLSTIHYPLSTPFVIRTPTATVTDLGTEFGVEVKQDGVSEVHLIQGKVKVRRSDQNDASNEEMTLSQGQAVRASPAQPGCTIIPAAVGQFRNMRARLAHTPKLEWPLMDKTLVAWVSLANTHQRAAGILSLTNMFEYDSIAFGELESGKWMAGSDHHARTQKEQSRYPIEMAEPNELVQIAIVYEWTSVTIYRNGKKYASYENDARQVFPKDAILLIGKQYLGAYPLPTPTLAGAVKEARLYNVALSPKMIASLRPNDPSPIGPVGQWTFEDGTARDVTGHFPMGVLQGNARIVDGKLLLDGQGSFLAVPPIGVKQPTLVSSSDFNQDMAPWFGQKLSGDYSPLPAPEMLSRVTGDTPDGSAGALRVGIACDSRYKYYSHMSGAIYLLETGVPAGTTIRISFFAKSLSGSTWLSVVRGAGGGDGQPIRIGPMWHRYQVDVPLGWTSPESDRLVFSLVGSGHGIGQPLADGVFLLDQVRVDRMPAMRQKF